MSIVSELYKVRNARRVALMQHKSTCLSKQCAECTRLQAEIDDVSNDIVVWERRDTTYKTKPRKESWTFFWLLNAFIIIFVVLLFLIGSL